MNLVDFLTIKMVEYHPALQKLYWHITAEILKTAI